MRKGKTCMYQIGISENEVDDIEIDKVFTLSNDSEKVEEYYLSVPYILFSQILGFYKSLILGLTPDSPSKSGAISRVVEGVVIY
jgi:tagatose-6-phosphate ketose/aldose isomerase